MKYYRSGEFTEHGKKQQYYFAAADEQHKEKLLQTLNPVMKRFGIKRFVEVSRENTPQAVLNELGTVHNGEGIVVYFPENDQAQSMVGW